MATATINTRSDRRTDADSDTDTDSDTESNLDDVTYSYAASHSSRSSPSSPIPRVVEEGRKKRGHTYSETLRSTRARYDPESGAPVETESHWRAEIGRSQSLIHPDNFGQVERDLKYPNEENSGRNLTQAKFDGQTKNYTATQTSHGRLGMESQALRSFSTGDASVHDNDADNDEGSGSEYGYDLPDDTNHTPLWNLHFRAAASDHHHDRSLWL